MAEENQPAQAIAGHLESIEECLTCPICLNLVRTPRICQKCDKVFCNDCIRDWLNGPANQAKCPHCQQPAPQKLNNFKPFRWAEEICFSVTKLKEGHVGLREMNENVQLTKQSIDHLHNQHDQFRVQLNTVTDQLETLPAQFQALASSMEQQTRKMEDVVRQEWETQRAVTNSNFDGIRHDLQAAYQADDERCVKLISAVTSSIDLHRTGTNQMDVLRSYLESFNDRLSEQIDELNRNSRIQLRDALGGLEAKFNQLETKMDGLEQKIDQVEQLVLASPPAPAPTPNVPTYSGRRVKTQSSSASSCSSESEDEVVPNVDEHDSSMSKMFDNLFSSMRGNEKRMDDELLSRIDHLQRARRSRSPDGRHRVGNGFLD